MNTLIEKVENRLTIIETVEIPQLRESVNKVERDVALAIQEVNRNTKSNEKLGDTLDTVKETMIRMSESIKTSTDATKHVMEEVKGTRDEIKQMKSEMDSKFKDVGKEIYQINDKTKVDVAKTTTGVFNDILEKGLAYIVGGGAILYVLENFINK